MYNGINRNSGVFTPEISDELNNAFSKTLDKIEKFKPTDLEPFYNTSSLSVSSESCKVEDNSFTIENKEVWINLKLTPYEELTSVKVADLSISVPDIIWVSFSTKHSVKNVPGYIEGTSLYLNGTLQPGTEYLVSTFFINV